MSGPFGSSQFMYATGAAEEGQSLRFEDGDSAYMTHTPTTAGNRRTWTFSTWIKRGNITSNQGIFGAESSGDRLVLGFGFSGSDQIRFYCQSPSTEIYTTSVLRDPSAWYNIVWAVDTTQATSTDRIKIYVNGEQITSFASASYPAQNSDYSVNNTVTQYIGRWAGYAGEYLDGYLANVCLIDGTALDPTSFGEYDGTLWKPKSDDDITSLTFGTNGFYLPFKQTTEAEGFSTVTWTGNGLTSQSVEGVGFEPDFIWIKHRSGSGWHRLQNTVVGINKLLYSNSTASEATNEVNGHVSSADANGFTLADPSTNGGGVNGSGQNYVAWCWDAGSGSAASNTDGSITSSVKSNTAKGFSIGTVTTRSQADTIGHGLSQAPDMVIFKPRNGALSWGVYHSSFASADNYLFLEGTNSVGSSSAYWNSTAPTSTVFSIGSTWGTYDAVFYAFHSVSGFSAFGSYSGTGATGNSITGLGFKPAWLMIKRTDNIGNWWILDNTRDVIDDDIESVLLADSSGAEFSTGTGWPGIDFTSDGFDLNATAGGVNASGGTYIYMAFADTRDATFFGDTSGNGNNWTPNAINNTDVVPDSPVTGGNFATFNPLDNIGTSNFSEGNLKVGSTTGSVTQKTRSTFAVSQNFYFEAYRVDGGTQNFNVGVATETANIGSTGNTGVYTKNYSGGAGDVLMFAYSASANALWTGLNGTWDNSATVAEIEAGTTTNATHTSIADEPIAAVFIDQASSYSGRIIANFGQDSSFAGNATPQGNTDDNGVGDFYYAPPSGFLALTTGNLPAATITAPDEYFNTVVYTGNGTAIASGGISVTGVNFQPDWVWLKSRTNAYDNMLFDSVRGRLKILKSNSTSAEITTNTENLDSFDADGFTYGSELSGNASGASHVAWNWLAGNGTVSNTDGSITSTVSANQTAGFSVVGYVGNGSSSQTVGHGLGSVSDPSLLIVKNRDQTDNWIVRMNVNGTNKFLFLDSTSSGGTSSVSLPTTDVFGVGTSGYDNTSGENYIAYLFSSVSGYSKIGSFTGNGSTDGTFVHCGFRPAWVMLKNSSTTGSWRMYDVKRPDYNPEADTLYAEGNYAEDNTSERIDILSNGFKIRSALTNNASGVTVIFLAFAEAPFKSANAR